MTGTALIGWSAVAIGAAAIATWLIQRLVALVAKTLPQWDRKQALAQLGKTYPGKSLEQILIQYVTREKTFSWMMKFLPLQCIIAMVVFASLWAWVIPPGQGFWIKLAQNLFVFEVALFAMIPAFRSLGTMQKMIIHRLQEILKKN